MLLETAPWAVWVQAAEMGSDRWDVSQGVNFRCTLVNITSNKFKTHVALGEKSWTCWCQQRSLEMTSARYTSVSSQQQTNVHEYICMYIYVCIPESVIQVYEKCLRCSILQNALMLMMWQSSGVLNHLGLKTQDQDSIQGKTKTVFYLQ